MCIYLKIIGGLTDVGAVSDVWKYTMDLWVTETPLGKPRYNHRTILLDDQFVHVGGTVPNTTYYRFDR